MAASTPASKRTQARRAPAKKAAAPALSAPSDLPDISDIPAELRFESTAYSKEEVAARETVDIAYTVKNSAGDPIEVLRLTARRPSDGFLHLIGLDFMTAAGDPIPTAQACLQFLFGAFDPVMRSMLRRRVYNPDDSLEMTDLVDIALTLLQRWGVKVNRDEE